MEQRYSHESSIGSSVTARSLPVITGYYLTDVDTRLITGINTLQQAPMFSKRRILKLLFSE